MQDGENMRRYATRQVTLLLGRLAFEVRKTIKMPGAETVHDLRVAIRRFSQSLRVFSSFFPQKERRKVRRVLDLFMELSSEVRNRDIALELLESHSTSLPSILTRFRAEREQAERELSDSLRRWTHNGSSSRWRAGLSL